MESCSVAQGRLKLHPFSASQVAGIICMLCVHLTRDLTDTKQPVMWVFGDK
jgi:hypothetical protein